MTKKVKCCECGREHEESLSNCCWIHCECGAEICGRCGKNEISVMKMPKDDDEAQYWCCKQCDNCGLEGCAMCI